MPSLADGLAALDTWLARVAPDRAARQRAPIPADVVRRRLSKAGLRCGDDVIALYGWHDGFTAFPGEGYIAPLDSGLALHREWLASDENMGYLPGLLPISFDIELDCDGGKETVVVESERNRIIRAWPSIAAWVESRRQLVENGAWVLNRQGDFELQPTAQAEVEQRQHPDWKPRKTKEWVEERRTPADNEPRRERTYAEVKENGALQRQLRFVRERLDAQGRVVERIAFQPGRELLARSEAGCAELALWDLKEEGRFSVLLATVRIALAGNDDQPRLGDPESICGGGETIRRQLMRVGDELRLLHEEQLSRFAYGDRTIEGP